MNKIYKLMLLGLFSLVLFYIMGPRVTFDPVEPHLPQIDIDLSEVASYIASRESLIDDLKENNQSQIVWVNPDSIYATDYVVLFWHGFSASPMEGIPVASEVARRIGANYFAPLLADSGRSSSDSFKKLTPAQMMNSAKESLALAKKIGKKVIVVSSSTGGTYSAYLAAHLEEIHSLIMLSPNIDLADRNSELILYPWGRQMLDLIVPGDHFIMTHYTPDQEKYWNTSYHEDGVVALKYLLKETMTSRVFKKITQPVFVGCYYQDSDHQDKVVSVSEMHEFYDQLGTLDSSKRFQNFSIPQHVLTSDLFNPQTALVIDHIMKFVKEVLEIEEIKDAEAY